MKILYHINEKRFIVEDEKDTYVVSIPKQIAGVVDNPASILRQGYWQEYTKDDPEIKRKISKLIGRAR